MRKPSKAKRSRSAVSGTKATRTRSAAPGTKAKRSRPVAPRAKARLSRVGAPGPTATGGGEESARVDAYIAESADFARPILQRIRKLFHEGCPEIEEQIKWGCPHFDYKGMVGGMAAFKEHVSFGFWKSRLMSDPHQLFVTGPKASMCVIKAGSPADLPPDRVFVQYVEEAVALNDADVKAPRPAAKAKPPPQAPDDLTTALNKNAQARATFDAFSPSQKREYIAWIAEARRDDTRRKRLATAVEWIAQGKRRNWKYMPKK